MPAFAGMTSEVLGEGSERQRVASALRADLHLTMTLAAFRMTSSWNTTATAKVMPKNRASWPLVSGRPGLRADRLAVSLWRSAATMDDSDNDMMISSGLRRVLVSPARVQE